jgi:hypothetical protein
MELVHIPVRGALVLAPGCSILRFPSSLIANVNDPKVNLVLKRN